MEWKNEITQLLKTDYPIVQAPMLGVTTPQMVAAVSNAGGLGSLPVGGLSPEQTLQLVRKTKGLTDQTFAVNLFAHSNAAPNEQPVEDMSSFLEKLCLENNLAIGKEDLRLPRFYSYTEQIQVLLDEQVSIVSFTFGILNDECIRALKENGVALIGTATCLAEAILLDNSGIDIITAQGIEAGGHRGTFIEGPLPQIGLISLVSAMAAKVKIPVLAAGGINNGRAIKAVMMLGARGAQVGTAFIAAHESAAGPSYRKELQNAGDNDTILTRSFSGRWARGIRNKFITEVDGSGLQIPGYPLQVGLTMPVRAMAQQQDNKDFMPLWAGQSSSGAEAKPAAEIFMQLVKEAREVR